MNYDRREIPQQTEVSEEVAKKPLNAELQHRLLFNYQTISVVTRPGRIARQRNWDVSPTMRFTRTCAAPSDAEDETPQPPLHWVASEVMHARGSVATQQVFSHVSSGCRCVGEKLQRLW